MYYNMLSKLSVNVRCILTCLLSTVFMLSACKPDLSERDFVLSQQRDNRLIGSWKKIRISSENNYSIIREYTSDGKIKQYDNGKLSLQKQYFYTKGNILYVFELGDGFKVSNWTWEYVYRFSEDGNILYTRPKDGSIESKWQRIVNSQQK